MWSRVYINRLFYNSFKCSSSNQNLYSKLSILFIYFVLSFNKSIYHYLKPFFFFPLTLLTSPPVSPSTLSYFAAPPGSVAAMAAQSAPALLPPQPGALVRMQGLPYNAGVKDILSFFQGYQVTLHSTTHSLIHLGSQVQKQVKKKKKKVGFPKQCTSYLLLLGKQHTS